MIPVEQLHAIEDELQGKMQRWIKQVIRTIMRQNPGHTLDEWLEVIEQPVDLEDPAQGHQGEPWLIAALQETGLPDFPLPILFLHWGVAPPLRVTSYERASDAGIDLPGYSSIFEHILLWILLEDFDFASGDGNSIWHHLAEDYGMELPPGLGRPEIIGGNAARLLSEHNPNPPFWIHGSADGTNVPRQEQGPWTSVQAYFMANHLYPDHPMVTQPEDDYVYMIAADPNRNVSIQMCDWPGGAVTDVPLVLEPIAPAILWAAESGCTKQADDTEITPPVPISVPPVVEIGELTITTWLNLAVAFDRFIDQPVMRYSAWMVILLGPQTPLPGHLVATTVLKINAVTNAGRELRFEFLALMHSDLDPVSLYNPRSTSGVTLPGLEARILQFGAKSSKLPIEIGRCSRWTWHQGQRSGGWSSSTSGCGGCRLPQSRE